MKKSSPINTAITGLGITSAIGQGKASFHKALMNGEGRFNVMSRPGRQAENDGEPTQFFGAEVPTLELPDTITPQVIRTSSFSAQMALTTLAEAWRDAELDQVDPSRVGLIVGGSNLQQRELVETQKKYADNPQYLRPTYSMSFMDTDICGLCTEQFGIKGFAFTVGGASASGQLAVIEAINAVESGRVDSCIAIGAPMDLSYWECQGFRSSGAMGSDRFQEQPELACRPFDSLRDGFIYGEACAVLVIEREQDATARQKKPYANITGSAIVMDANRNPNPSVEGESHVINQALDQARMNARDIDYVNPHGSGSVIGDETELSALKKCGVNGARINATKSITGHGLTAAGAVEIVSTILQMEANCLHPTLNLQQPIDDSFNWVKANAETHSIQNALSLSMGFGGINTAICIQNC